jgi:(p)ppGpp synthase/HD superfamily hydrolase
VKGSDVAGHVISPDEADALAARILGDRRTTLGELHISHARRVAAGLDGSADDRLVAAALLHDVLEKTAVTAEELRAMTGDAGCVDLVEVLTQAAGSSRPARSARRAPCAMTGGQSAGSGRRSTHPRVVPAHPCDRHGPW